MTTIRLVDAATVTGRTKEIFDAVLLRERKVFGARSVSNIWRCMGHAPALLEANWNRSRALMQRGRFSPLQRELIATAVSVANACTIESIPTPTTRTISSPPGARRRW